MPALERNPQGKLSNIKPDTGVIDDVFVACRSGTSIDIAGALPGFTPYPDRWDASVSDRQVVFHGTFDTSGSNLIEAAKRSFINFIQGNYSPRGSAEGS